MITKSAGVPPLPASCLAEYVTANGRSPESILRPYKFRQRGEGRARMTFYPPALGIIRKYHKSGRKPAVFDSAILEWQRRADETDKTNLRTKMHSNIMALQSYRKLYKDRNFKILPSHRITYQIGQLVWTAPPDLWVEEDGTQILIKIGFAKKKRSYVEILLTVMRKAAARHGYKIRPKNIVYLDVRTGEERICETPLNHFNRTFSAAAGEIIKKWPKVMPTSRSTPL